MPSLTTEDFVGAVQRIPVEDPAATLRGRNWQQVQCSRFVADDTLSTSKMCLPWSTLPGYKFTDAKILRLMGQQLINEFSPEARKMEKPEYRIGNVRLSKTKGDGTFYLLKFNYEVKETA